MKGALALMIVAGFIIGPVARAAEPPLSVAGGEMTRALTFTKGCNTESATLTLMVRNDGDVGGTLLVRFLDESGAEASITPKATPVEGADSSLPQKRPSGTTAKSPALTVRLLTPSKLAVKAHDATQLTVEFRQPASSAQEPVSGNLIIALSKTPTDRLAGPVVVPVKIDEVAADLKFGQEKATISLIRLLGPLGALASGCTKCLLGESVRVQTRGVTPTEAEATINSDTGGSATVNLTRTVIPTRT